MTSKQEAVWSLYAAGHRITDIARLTGRSNSSVSSMISTIKRNMQHPVERPRSSTVCIYSSSCFTCPMRDCVVNDTMAGRCNVLPGDMELRR